MPHQIQPMLAMLIDKPFDREGWFFEVKWDGYRAIAEKEGSDIRLYSRKNLSFNEKFPPITQSLRSLNHDAILDGEVVVLDRKGRARFQLLQDFSKNHSGILVYYIFDLLFLDGYDLRSLPLTKRKSVLKQILPRVPNLRYSSHIETKGTAFLRRPRSTTSRVLSRRIHTACMWRAAQHIGRKLKTSFNKRLSSAASPHRGWARLLWSVGTGHL